MTCPMCGGAAIDRTPSLSGSALQVLYARHGITLKDVPTSFEGMSCVRCSFGWYSPVFAGAPSLYEDLQKNAWYYDAARPEFPFALAHVAAGQRVLEVGCGEGNFLVRLPTGTAHLGLEFNDASLRKCLARSLNVRKLPVQDLAAHEPHSFDVVCSFQVLEHVSAPRAFLEDCLACLKPGGLLILSVPNDEGPMARMTNAWLNLPPHHLSRWREQTFRHFAQQQGLTVEQVMRDPIDAEHRTWIRDQEATRWLGSLLGVEHRPVRNDPLWRALVLGGKLLGPFTGDRFCKGVGHSITVVLRKPAVAAV